MMFQNTRRGLLHLHWGVAWILYFLLMNCRNHQVLALENYTVRNIQTSLLANDTVRISWDVVEPAEPSKIWSLTHVTLQSEALTSSVRYPLRRDIYTVDYGIDDNGMHRGTKYDIKVQLVDNLAIPVSDEEQVAIIIPPRKPASFNATLSNGFMKFNYHLQRRSLYSGVQIECGHRRADGTINTRVREKIDFEYSSKYENMAIHRPTFMSTTFLVNGFYFNSSYAVDGFIGLNTNFAQTNPVIYWSRWWMVELRDIAEIQKLIYYDTQRVCGSAHCSTYVEFIKIFYSETSSNDPCDQGIQRVHRDTKPYEMVIVETFAPTFLAKYIAICGYEGLGSSALRISEVEVFKPEHPIIQTRGRALQTNIWQPGTFIDCDAFAIATIDGEKIKSAKHSLAQKVFIRGGDVTDSRDNTRESEMVSHPADRKTTTKVSQPQTTTPNTSTKPDNLTIALYGLSISSVLIFSSIIGFIIKKKVKQNRLKKTLEPMHGDLQPGDMYVDLLPQSTVSDNFDYSTTQYSTFNRRLIPEIQQTTSSRRESRPLPSPPPTDRIPITSNIAVPQGDIEYYSMIQEPNYELPLHDSPQPRKKKKPKLRRDDD